MDNSEQNYNPVVLLLIDGFGIGSKEFKGNLFEKIDLPNWQNLISTYPVVALDTPFKKLGSLSLSECYEAAYLSMGKGYDYKKTLLEGDDPQSLAKYLDDKGLKQLHTSHPYSMSYITYFFNGKRKYPYSNEVWDILESHGGDFPEMMVKDLFKNVINFLSKDLYEFYVMNIPNLIAIGNKGDVESELEVLKLLDNGIGQLVTKILEKNGTVILSASHGYIENMYDVKIEQILKTPTKNPVPCIIINRNYEGQSAASGDVVNGDLSVLSVSGSLQDIAPTILRLYGLDQPEWMTGKCLI